MKTRESILLLTLSLASGLREFSLAFWQQPALTGAPIVQTYTYRAILCFQ